MSAPIAPTTAETKSERVLAMTRAVNVELVHAVVNDGVEVRL